MADKSNGNGNGNGFEKTPWQSKKFWIFFIATITWKLLLGAMVILWVPNLLPTVIMMTVVITAGFVEAYAIGGQAGIDRYVRVAQINAGMLGKRPGAIDGESSGGLGKVIEAIKPGNEPEEGEEFEDIVGEDEETS